MSTSLEGRRFRPMGAAEEARSGDGGDVGAAGARRGAGGEVGAETVFEYHEEGDLVWARYSGGSVRLGHLVGLRAGDELEFRYSQLNTAGETSNGHCRSTIHRRPDGRLELRETWEWESRPGAGSSTVVEDA